MGRRAGCTELGGAECEKRRAGRKEKSPSRLGRELAVGKVGKVGEISEIGEIGKVGKRRRARCPVGAEETAAGSAAECRRRDGHAV